MLIDPDGNPILIDQHVDSPPKANTKPWNTLTSGEFLGIVDEIGSLESTFGQLPSVHIGDESEQPDAGRSTDRNPPSIREN